LSLLAAIVTAVTLINCVTAKTEGCNNPALPAPQSRLYGGIEIGYAITIPRNWSAFNLSTQIDLAANQCSPELQLRDARRCR
jgi:hypothetical protein